MKTVWQVAISGSMQTPPYVGLQHLAGFYMHGTVVLLDRRTGADVKTFRELSPGACYWLELARDKLLVRVPAEPRLLLLDLSTQDWRWIACASALCSFVASGIVCCGMPQGILVVYLELDPHYRVVRSLLVCRLEDGRDEWTRELGPQRWNLFAISGDIAVLWDGASDVRKVDKPLIEVKTTTGETIRQPPLSHFGLIRLLAVDDHAFYFSSPGGDFFALDRESLEQRWRLNLGPAQPRVPPVFDDDTLWLAVTGKVIRIDRNSGAALGGLQCRVTDRHNAIQSPPLIAGDRVYVGSNNCHLWCYDKRTGEVIDRQRVRGYIAHTPVLHEGRIYVGTTHGYAYCVDAD